jgi:hypothetical protein
MASALPDLKELGEEVRMAEGFAGDLRGSSITIIH